MKYLLDLTYDGSEFYGFQKQKKEKTVQGEIEGVLSKIFNCEITITGASRTDRGVHAYNQYAHFEVNNINDIEKTRNSINKMIDDSIYIKRIQKVEDDFSARYDVKMKEYVYKINVGEYVPMDKNYVFQYNRPINISLMNKAIKKIKGKHNFKSFTSDTEQSNYERDIKSIKIIKYKNYVFIIFKAKSFLRYMIRNIVGLLLDINEGKKSVNDIEKIFESENRSSNGRTAEPEGLYLNEIWY